MYNHNSESRLLGYFNRFSAQYEEWKKENSEEDKDDDTASSVEEEMSSEAE